MFRGIASPKRKRKKIGELPIVPMSELMDRVILTPCQVIAPAYDITQGFIAAGGIGTLLVTRAVWQSWIYATGEVVTGLEVGHRIGRLCRAVQSSIIAQSSSMHPWLFIGLQLPFAEGLRCGGVAVARSVIEEGRLWVVMSPRESAGFIKSKKKKEK